MNDTIPKLEEKYDIDSNGCWNWNRFVDHNGYGSFRIKGNTRTAHRVIWELLRGKVPEGLVLDHLCRNRKCVNPEHLEVVTQRENCMRGLIGGKTHCKNGHLFDEENTLISQGEKQYTRRNCKSCDRIRKRAYRGGLKQGKRVLP